MSSLRHRAAWMPPLLVGAALAIAAEVAVGMLLYASEGLMRSLSTVLVVEVAALAAGLWSAPGPGPNLVDRLRRRWVLCLVAFLFAALYGTSWTVLLELGETAIGQGFGLAIMAALPLYTCGTVLGGMATVAATDGRGPPRRGPSAAAAMGAAIGFAVTGLMLARSPVPSSLLIGSLGLLSFGGMVYGAVLGARLQIDVRAKGSTAGGRVRVEDRRMSAEGVASRLLFEGEYVRRAIRLQGELAVVPWDVAVARGLMPSPEAPWRVLVVGGGASPLPRTVVGEHPTGSVQVLERHDAVVEMGSQHFETGLGVGEMERSSVAVGNLDDLVEELTGSFDLIVVDGAALVPLGGASGLSRRARAALAQRVSAAGVLAWGPTADPCSASVEGWSTTTLARASENGEREVVLLTGPELPATDLIEGFQARNGGTEDR